MIVKTKKEDYIDKMAAQLKDWSARIDELEARAGTIKSDMKEGYENRIHELKEKRDAVTRKLQETGKATDEAWETFKTGVDHAWEDLKGAITAAREKFRKSA
jgi:uncharacterized coiled-coil DUF342 family protein